MLLDHVKLISMRHGVQPKKCLLPNDHMSATNN